MRAKGRRDLIDVLKRRSDRLWRSWRAFIAATGIGLATVVHAAEVTHNSVKLKWTATGDDSLTGRAAQYDLRFSTSPITAVNFASATRWTVGAPSVSGAMDSTTITGLTPETAYWFAVKVADEVPNWSGISNVYSVTTLAAPDTIPPAAVRDLSGGGTGTVAAKSRPRSGRR